MRTTSVDVHIRTMSLYEAVSTTSDDTLEADLSQVSFHQDDVFHIEDLSVLIWEHVILYHN